MDLKIHANTNYPAGHVSCTIRDAAGKILGHWKAKTVRGFNRRQLREMAAVRAGMAR